MAHRQFELVGGALCLDFVNTVHEYGAADPREELHSYQDLVAFALQVGAISAREAAALVRRAVAHPALAGKTLAAARECRLSLYRIFSAIAGGTRPSGKDLDIFNRQLPGVLQNLRVQRKGSNVQWTWKNENGNVERVLWPIVRSAAELLTSKDLQLVRECGSETCTWLFLDHSKNRTRRWCDMKICGNRAKWRRHYDRVKKKEPGQRQSN